MRATGAGSPRFSVTYSLVFEPIFFAIPAILRSRRDWLNRDLAVGVREDRAVGYA